MSAKQRALCLLFICGIVPVMSTGFYSIVAPKVLRPNMEYHVAVSMQKTSQPTKVTVEVGGRQDSGGTFVTTNVIEVEPYTTRILKLEIGDLGPGSYNLTARGVNGLEFINTTALEYIHKSYSVFIQTDKAIYKPGHKILFRAVVLNTHLKPAVTGPLDVFISDGKGNRIKQWNRVLTRKGVFSEELQLSESPVLGDWNITVNVLDQTFSKSFQVAEYVLPKFEVLVDVPKHATFKDSRIVATIRAKYTYGKSVKGEATVTAYPTFYSGVLQPIFQTPVRKVIPIDGKTTVEFDLSRDLQLTDEFERIVQFDVAVEEALTGRRQNNSAQVTVHKYKYKMELIKTSEYFKPGLKYTAFIKLSYHDGAPVRDENNLVSVKYGYSYDQSLYKVEKFKLNNDGMIELNFFPPADSNTTIIGFEAEYLDLAEWFSSVTAAMSPSNSFIQAIVKTEKPTVNEDIEIEVNSTASLKYFSYEVIGRGDIVIANTVQVPDQKSFTFRFLATYAMAPTAHVVVYYLRDDGEVVADALDIQLDGALQNFVNISMNPKETQPGGNVNFVVEAKPHSYVGLLGIDQSVLLLKSGNDFTEEDVLEELQTYDTGYNNPYHSIMFKKRRKRSFFWWPGSSTAKEVFDKSGAVIMTNGYVFEHSPFRKGMESGPGNIARNGPHIRPTVAPDADAFKPDLGPPVMSSFVTRPPLAGPYAFSRIPPPIWSGPRVFLLHDLAPTWLFSNFSLGYEGRANLKKAAPDTITSWVITGFSLDPIYGLGLTDSPTKLRVFRPFFVSLDLPYSVIRGETVAIPIVVFNYMDKEVTAEVTLENPGLENFEFAEISNDISGTSKLELYQRKKLNIKANSGAAVSFMITPKKLGYISLKVTATSPLAGDAVERQLLVKAEGETQYRNKAIFADLRKSNKMSENITLDIPENIVLGSERIEVSTVGDILGPSIPNLANLIQMPSGCGEQNMLNFVPNIVVIEYLKNTNQLTKAIESKATNFMEIGYQQELTYRREDGSFSAFGNSDPNGSTWLTAFVAKSFRQAMPHINIDDAIIRDALQWLANNQAPNGSFPEVGKVSHTDMQGGAGKGLALTAYTVIAFLENQQAVPIYQNTINKAIDYIIDNLNDVNDIYAISLVSYALNLAKHSARDGAFHILESKARATDEMKWWEKPVEESDKENPWHSLPKSVDVEMTAYGLLTYLERGLIEDSIPVMKWLVSQRNEKGGFASTQDTVIGIYALAKLGERISSQSVNIGVSFSYPGGNPISMRVNRGNSMILQKQELPPKVREVNITATGEGFAVIQVSYQYNVNVTGAWPMFTLDPQVDKNSDSNHLQLSICSGFSSKTSNQSNMAVMEVTLPSGFTVDSDTLPSLRVSENVKRVETKDGDTVVMLYFDQMTRREYCPTVSAFRTHKVAKQKPVPVTIYDYYDSSRRARVFYEPRVATLCDICEGEDCGNICTGDPSDNPLTGSNSACQSVSSCWMFTLICFSVLVLLERRR